jgi:DNA adenine methylase
MRLGVRPFLKWTGGKQWLTFVVRDVLLDLGDPYYFEPFLGGGSVFFSLQPSSSYLSDSNSDLVATYRAVRDNVEAVIEKLSKLKNNKTTFLRVRASEPDRTVDRAVRMIYLNKTAFNGMYRVNRDGRFNVPYGRFASVNICQEDRLREASSTLAGSTLRTAGFQRSLAEVRCGDLVYLDPPYVTTHNNNGFLKYNSRLFSWADQKRLADLAEKLRCDGAVVLISNAAHGPLLELYPYFHAYHLQRNSLIGGGNEFRGSVTEVLLSSIPLSL